MDQQGKLAINAKQAIDDLHDFAAVIVADHSDFVYKNKVEVKDTQTKLENIIDSINTEALQDPRSTTSMAATSTQADEKGVS
jgi:hypothetical protein